MSDHQQTTPLEDLTGGDHIRDGQDPAASLPPEPTPSGPRTRWAGIVWGLALAAVAAAGVWLASGAGRADELVAWARTLTVATGIGYGVLALGALVLITGLVGLLRRAQRRLGARAQS